MFDLDMYFLAGLFAQDDQDTVVSLTHFVEVVIAGLVGLYCSPRVVSSMCKYWDEGVYNVEFFSFDWNLGSL